MDLILLPGNNPKHKEWIAKVRDKLKDLFNDTYIHEYEHWRTGEEMIDLEKELKLLIKNIKNMEEYVIFAKSAGVALAANGIAEKKLAPSKCMFFGTPVLWCRENNIKIEEWLKGLNIPSLFLQKSQDWVMPASDLKKVLENQRVKNYEFIEIPGNDHHYDNLEQIRELMVSLLSR